MFYQPFCRRVCQRWLTVPSPLGKVSSLDDGRGEAVLSQGKGDRLRWKGCKTPHPSFACRSTHLLLEEKAFNCPHPSSVPLATFPQGKAFFVQILMFVVGVGFLTRPALPKFDETPKKVHKQKRREFPLFFTIYISSHLYLWSWP